MKHKYEVWLLGFTNSKDIGLIANDYECLCTSFYTSEEKPIAYAKSLADDLQSNAEVRAYFNFPDFVDAVEVRVELPVDEEETEMIYSEIVILEEVTNA